MSWPPLNDVVPLRIATATKYNCEIRIGDTKNLSSFLPRQVEWEYALWHQLLQDHILEDRRGFGGGQSFVTHSE